jgi:hypothetical protein
MDYWFRQTQYQCKGYSRCALAPEGYSRKEYEQIGRAVNRQGAA